MDSVAGESTRSENRGQDARRRISGNFRWAGTSNYCSLSLIAGVRSLGIEIRAGLHTGEVEVEENDRGYCSARRRAGCGAGRTERVPRNPDSEGFGRGRRCQLLRTRQASTLRAWPTLSICLPWRLANFDATCMSALDHKQTFRSAIAMSAFPSIADMCSATRHVRYVPTADIWWLFDHFVCASLQAGGTLRPRALAVFRLITNSYLVGACTGRSAGFSPLKIRLT